MILSQKESYALFPWTNDITLKIQVSKKYSEKYLIKGSSVKVKDTKLSDLVFLINFYGEKDNKPYVNCIERYGEDYYGLEWHRLYGYGDIHKKFLKIKNPKSFCDKKFGQYKNKLKTKPANHLRTAIGEKENIHFKEVEYRLVEFNIYKEKIDYGIKDVICINPKLSSQTLEIWKKYYDVDRFLPKGTPIVGDVLKAKVCKKYASYK
tara:strand:+ start:923 stop:1543 length:621 start_codon:yes stop_codon:yes gene_type:complete